MSSSTDAPDALLTRLRSDPRALSVCVTLRFGVPDSAVKKLQLEESELVLDIASCPDLFLANLDSFPENEWREQTVRVLDFRAEKRRQQQETLALQKELKELEERHARIKQMLAIKEKQPPPPAAVAVFGTTPTHGAAGAHAADGTCLKLFASSILPQ